MTKQLAPIKLLARKYITASGYAIIANSELEELRQAIIRDFVSTLEPVGEVIKDENQIKEIVFNAHHWTHILSVGDKLYELPIISEWKSK